MKNSGQSLVEVLLAIAVVSLVALGLVKAATFSVKNAGFSKDQGQATGLAQKKISGIIDQKNQNPRAFFLSLPSPSEEITPPFCVKTAVTDSRSSLPTTTPNYSQAQMAKISVNVYWGEKSVSCSIDCDCGAKIYQSYKHFETYVTD